MEAPNQMNTAVLQTLEENGVGINQSMDLLKEMLPNLMTSQKIEIELLSPNYLP